MAVESSKISDGRLAAVVPAASLLLLVVAYIALCLVALYRPDWLPSSSILHASLVGPPHWLVGGAGADVMFWGSTFAVASVAVIGARFQSLLLPCAGLCFLIWLSSGFLSVAMSV